jgi:hypothetical protein
MARIRSIKPEFWKHEDLSALSAETHMLAAALLNYSDDEGFFNANPALVKAECCPLRDDSTTVRRALDELSNIGYLRLFQGTDGKCYGHVVKFKDHQRVDRPKASKIRTLDPSMIDRRQIDDESTEEGKGREQGTGKGNTSSTSAAGGTSNAAGHEFSMHADWQPNLKFEDRLTMSGIPSHVFTIENVGEFKSFWMTEPGTRLTQSKWEHKLIQALRRASHVQQQSPDGTPNGPAGGNRAAVVAALRDVENTKWAN